MRYAFLALTFLMLSACTAVNGQQGSFSIPETFLGHWNPYSRTAGNVAVHIFKDGHIEYRGHFDGVLMQTTYYKVIRIIGPHEVYLAVFKPAEKNNFGPADYKPNDGYQYIRLTMEPGEVPKEDYLQFEHGPIFEATEWNSFSPRQFWDDRQEKIDTGHQTSGTAGYTRAD